EGANGPRLVTSEVRLVRDGIAAYCRLDAPPRWIGFRSRLDPTLTHGILPLDVRNGELRMPAAGERWRYVAPARERRAGAGGAVYGAVDFGTSNSGIAFSTAGATGIQRLGFTPASRAVNVTAPASLDPTASLEFRLRFFPLNAEYSNPMP